MQQAHSKQPASTQQARNKHAASTQQARSKHTASMQQYAASMQQAHSKQTSGIWPRAFFGEAELQHIKIDNFRGLNIVCVLPSSQQELSLFAYDSYSSPKPTLPRPHTNPTLHHPPPLSELTILDLSSAFWQWEEYLIFSGYKIEEKNHQPSPNILHKHRYLSIVQLEME